MVFIVPAEWKTFIFLMQKEPGAACKQEDKREKEAKGIQLYVKLSGRNLV